MADCLESDQAAVMVYPGELSFSQCLFHALYCRLSTWLQ